MGENNQSPVKRPPVKWLAPVSVDRKGTTFGRPDLCTACRGNDDIAIVLNYFLYEASLEADRKKIDTSELQSIQLERTLDTILEGIGHSCSKKTLIKYISQLKTWELVYPHGYKKTYDVCFKKIAEAIKSPPEPEKKKPRGRHAKVKSTILTIPTIHDEKEVVQIEFLQSQIVNLQSDIVILQSQIVNLQSFVVSLQSLQRSEAAPQQALTRVFDPSRLIDCNETNRDVYISVASANGCAHTSLMQSLLTEDDLKTIDALIATLPMKPAEQNQPYEKSVSLPKHSESEKTHVHVSASSLPQLAGHPSIPAHGSNHARGDGNNHPDHSEVARQAQLNNHPIATTDPQPTLLQVEQGENNANPHLPAAHHHLPAPGADIPARADLGGTARPTHQQGVTQQEVSPPVVEKPAKPKKPVEPPVMPSEDAPWCAETLVQILEAKREGRYPNGAKKQANRIRDKALSDAQTIIDMEDVDRVAFVLAIDHLETRKGGWWRDNVADMFPYQLIKDDKIHTMMNELKRQYGPSWKERLMQKTRMNTATTHIENGNTQVQPSVLGVSGNVRYTQSAPLPVAPPKRKAR